MSTCLGLVSGHPRIRGLLHPLTTSILPQKARVHPRAGIKHRQKCGGNRLCSDMNSHVLDCRTAGAKINNKPNAADIICSGRLRQNREEDPGEYEGPPQRYKMWKIEVIWGPSGDLRGQIYHPWLHRVGVEDATRLSDTQKGEKQQKWDLHRHLPEALPSPKGLFIMAVSRGTLSDILFASEVYLRLAWGIIGNLERHQKDGSSAFGPRGSPGTLAGKKRSPLLLVNKCHLTLGEGLAGCPLPRPSLL